MSIINNQYSRSSEPSLRDEVSANGCACWPVRVKSWWLGALTSQPLANIPPPFQLGSAALLAHEFSRGRTLNSFATPPTFPMKEEPEAGASPATLMGMYIRSRGFIVVAH
jgi:hypothetical protein